ncbi:phosphoglycerol geranylgeranyltransferase [Croceiramulus getboli]|nr:phosphoglycerol geranylgeranyltransferase [Flavobacteriaceae bacterium YJPT1-3]
MDDSYVKPKLRPYMHGAFSRQLRESATLGIPLLAVLIDPEKWDTRALDQGLQSRLAALPEQTTHLFVGGSTDHEQRLHEVVVNLKRQTELPVILFPGDHRQLTDAADGLLFLSLLSGDNPEYLIGQQRKAIPKLRQLELEVIPTGYLLIDGGRESAVQRISQTLPFPADAIDQVVQTCLAAQWGGKQAIYLEAGSGALHPVSAAMVEAVRESIDLPIIVGGGIRSLQTVNAMYAAGATLVVIGTALEEATFDGKA